MLGWLKRGRSGDDIADPAWLAREGWVGLDELDDLVVSHVGIGLPGRFFEQGLLEVKIVPLVFDVDAVIGEREHSHYGPIWDGRIQGHRPGKTKPADGRLTQAGTFICRPHVGGFVPFGSDPLDALVVPNGTRAEERDIVTDGDAVIGGKSRIEFGVRARSVLAGERVRFGGGLEAEADCRLDTWCDVDGNVLVGQDAYLGERVHVAGQLLVNGDLDVGDDATIEEGFEANGFIHIRNPLPLYLFLVIYLTHLLRRGAIEDATSFVEAVTAEEPDGAVLADADMNPDPDPLLVPRKSRVSDDQWQVPTPARIGAGCRLHGNIRAESITVGRETTCYGSLRSGGDIEVDEGVTVHGDITARGATVTVAARAVVKGDIACGVLDVHTDAAVEGRITTSEEVRIRSPIESDPDPGAANDTDAGAHEVADTDTDAEGMAPTPPATDPEDERPKAVSAHDTAERTATEPGDPPSSASGGGEAETGQSFADATDATGTVSRAAGSESIEAPDDEEEVPANADRQKPTESETGSGGLPIIDAEEATPHADGPDDEPGLVPTASAIAEIETRHVVGEGKDPSVAEAPDSPDGLESDDDGDGDGDHED